MKFLILQIVLVLIHCDETNDKKIVSRQQMDLFKKITGINASEAQAVWQRVDSENSTIRKRRSTGSNILPKFRLEVTDVSSIVNQSVFYMN